MRRQKKLLAALAVLVLVIFAGIFSTSNIKASAASNSLSATYRLMYIGQSYTAKVKGSYSSVKWSTSNSNIASVNSSGKVTGVNEGRANIYATVDGKKLTLKVEVVSKSAYQAVSYANKAVGSRYSQSRRMSKGYYDCSSLVWRSYASAGVYIGGKTDWAPTAASTGSILNKAYKVVSYSSVKTSELLPGDLIFTSTKKNGRYRNITHAAIYVGNGKIVEAANSKTGVVKRNYSTKNIVLIARPTVNVSKTLQQPQMTSTKVTSSSVNNTSIKVTWNKVRGASGYYVYRKVAGSGEAYKKIATVKGNSKVEYTDKKAYAGQYIYTVRAYSGSKISPYNSKGMTARTKIAAPSNVSGSEGTEGIAVTWDTVKYATGYKIYRKEAGSSYSLIKTVSGQKSSLYEDTEAESGTAYTYVVRAFRKNSSSNIVTSASSAATASVVYTEPIVVAASDTAETAAAADTTAETGSSEESSSEESDNASESSPAESSVEETSVEETSSESSASDAGTETSSEESSASQETGAAESSAVSESN